MGFPNILDVAVREKGRGWMMIKLTLYGNHLQRVRVGAAVTTGPEKGGEELTKGKVKKGLKRGHGQGQSRANREDLSSLLPSAGLCQRLTSATPSRTQKAREPLVLLSSDPVLGYTGQGEKRRSERQRITSMPESPQPWGKCVLNTTLIVHYCFPWTCA